jgi:hypothetical protein
LSEGVSHSGPDFPRRRERGRYFKILPAEYAIYIANGGGIEKIEDVCSESKLAVLNCKGLLRAKIQNISRRKSVRSARQPKNIQGALIKPATLTSGVQVIEKYYNLNGGPAHGGAQLATEPRFSPGPFRNKDTSRDVRQYPRVAATRPIEHERFRREIVEYFERRLQRLQIIKTTISPRGQTIDWIPIESQHPGKKIATPPPTPDGRWREGQHPELLAVPELKAAGADRGPKGTVPILRKNLQALGYTKSLKKYLSKTRGHRIVRLGGRGLAAPEEDGQHRYANSGQFITCFGGEGQLSCFDPYLESSDDFSLIQIGLSNNDLGFLQTVEAGWQEFEDLTGDWVPCIFTYYTTNGYSESGDDLGGYNTDVDGWVQIDDTIFPGATFTPHSTPGGEQRKIMIKYQLFEGNWWFFCQGSWIGYYPASLFQGDQGAGLTLGDHADHIGFWGEIFDSEDVSGRTTSDMGSGFFAEAGWKWAAYMHNLLVQTDPAGSISPYDGSSGLSSTDPDMYDIEQHFRSGTDWGSFVFLGGPGASRVVPYGEFLIQTGTALGQVEDGNGDFLMADFDQDGIPDLVFIKRRNTASNSIEVHVLSGSSNFQEFVQHTGTPLGQVEDGNGDFLMADFDQDGIADLVFIKRRNSGTNTIEVHVLSGSSNFQEFIQQTGTALAQVEDANGNFLTADFDQDGTPDLVFIKRRNTGTNTIEVHILSGSSNFQDFIVQTGTPLGQVEDGNGDFLMADFDQDGIPDLVFIKRRNTSTNTIEVHILSGTP